jgi:tetratricopeptide (TPR) repeat protein
MWRSIPEADAAGLDFHISAALDVLLNQASVFYQIHSSVDTALEYARAALRLKMARLDHDEAEVGDGHDRLGAALAAGKLWSEAVNSHREALRIAGGHGASHPLLGTRQVNLASALRGQMVAEEMAGDALIARLQEIETLERSAYKNHRALFGALHDRTAGALNNLAITCEALGDRRRARRISTLALATRRKIIFPGDPRIAYPLTNIGALYLKDCAPEQALPMLRESLRILEDVFGSSSRPEILIATADWLTLCLLALPTPDFLEAWAVCERYGFDFDYYAGTAAQYRPPPP